MFYDRTWTCLIHIFTGEMNLGSTFFGVHILQHDGIGTRLILAVCARASVPLQLWCHAVRDIGRCGDGEPKDAVKAFVLP